MIILHPITLLLLITLVAVHSRQLKSSSQSWKTDLIQGIELRKQWHCNFVGKSCCKQHCNTAICDGYCGSVSLQESLLYYGAYVSQGIIRRIVQFNDKESAQDILIATDRPNQKPDFEKTAKLLGLDPKPWYALKSNKSGLSSFLNWATTELKPPYYAPVAMGVIFRGSKESTYEHIVTAIKGTKSGLWFYDHYSNKSKVVNFLSMPRKNKRCKKGYCFSKNMYAVSLRRPQQVPKESLVRLNIIENSGGSRLSEPNWTCASSSPSTLTLSASFPFYTPNGKKQYMAIVLQADNASAIRNTNSDPYSGTIQKCMELPSDPSSAEMTFEVLSNQAVYTKVVTEGEGCPL